MELAKITSFQVDHTKLDRGMYISRIDGDIITYDIRMKKPNAEPVLENAALHTIEHLFATYVRSSEVSESVIYFGPMVKRPLSSRQPKKQKYLVCINSPCCAAGRIFMLPKHYGTLSASCSITVSGNGACCKIQCSFQ